MTKEHSIPEQTTMIGLLTALFPQSTIYLFGSRARGTNTDQSDIDIALDLGRKMTLQEISRAKNVLDGLNIANTIDIIDMHRISEEMKKITTTHETETLLALIESRNLSTHVYNTDIAEEVTGQIPHYYTLLTTLLPRIAPHTLAS